MPKSDMDWLLNFVGKVSDFLGTAPWYFQLPLWGIFAILIYVLVVMVREE